MNLLSSKIKAPLIEGRGLSHNFDYMLYEDIDISLERGYSISIVGKSGSGKSTLLHNLSGFLKPLKGNVFIERQDIYSLNEKKADIIRRYDIGIIFQMHYLFKGMSARENIEISALLAKREVDREILRRLDIENILDQRASTLSGGQQQRVSIARVLAKEPKILFADEPTGNLDRENADIVIDTMLSYIKQRDASLFLVTHDEEIANRCDIVYRLEDKKLIVLKNNSVGL